MSASRGKHPVGHPAASDPPQPVADGVGGRSNGSAWSHWPKAATACILANVFFERFAFYGVEAVLLYYLVHLGWDEDDSTGIYHSFTVLSYFTPMLGALLADGYIGKFRTILCMAVPYALGCAMLTGAAVALPEDEPHRWLDLAALSLIALGAGGTTACVPPFGPDQFGAGDEHLIDAYFSVYYIALSLGSLMSKVFDPVLSDVRCMGQITCYPLSFGVPTAFMLISVVILLLGARSYRHIRPKENIFAEVYKVVARALKNKCHYSVERRHWLDHYMDSHMCRSDRRCTKYACHKATLVGDTKNLLRLLLMFLPCSFFWTLYEQRGSRWLIQAEEMDYKVLGWNMPPAMIQGINPILALAFVPLVDMVVYPLVRMCGVRITQLRRLVAGGLLAALAFVVAGLLQLYWINPTRPHQPEDGTSHVGFINALGCDARVTVVGGEVAFTLAKADGAGLEAPDAPWSGHSHNVRSLAPTDTTWSFSVDDAQSCNLPQITNGSGGTWTQNITLPSTDRQYYTILHGQFVGDGRELPVFEGTLEKDKQALGLFKINLNDLRQQRMPNEGAAYYLCSYGEQSESHRCDPGDSYNFLAVGESDIVLDDDGAVISKFFTLLPNRWRLYKQNGTESHGEGAISANAVHPIDLGVQFEVDGEGGIYMLTIYDNDSAAEGAAHVLVKAVSDNTVGVLWQIPQIVVITAAEVVFCISGLEFAYTQCAPSMKSIVSAMWLVCISIGHVVVIIVAEGHMFADLAYEMFFYAVLMVVAMAVLTLLAVFYYDYNDYAQAEEDKENGDVGMASLKR